MPSIAEKIAARRAAALNETASPPPAKQPPKLFDALAKKMANAKQQIADSDAEWTAAIDRIEPPGKHERAEAARKTARLILNANPPPAPKPDIRAPDAQERRSLGAEDGETVDMTPQSASQAEEAWHAAFNAFESDLCLMTDPHNTERAWIAVRLDGQEDWPILLKSLPLYEHPRTVRPANQPF
jgi:hypothetical protein